MSYTILFVHAVWATKERQPLLIQDVLEKLLSHIRENARTKNIHIDSLNGHKDHIHCLISMDSSQTLANILNLIKGESSFWINKNKLTKSKFEWQDDYFASSVSPSVIAKVRHYNQNQNTHHQKKTFKQEYEEFIKSCDCFYEKG
jgi:putative transposase